MMPTTDRLPMPDRARAARRRGRSSLLALALCLASGAAPAHDTWFALQPAAADGAQRLALGTGDRFPVQEFTLTMAQLSVHGCRAGTEPAPLQFAADTPSALRLRAGSGASSCWAQSVPFEIELESDKIAIYLKEINAPQAVRDAWAGMQARGLPWKERYSKHARIELTAPAPLAAAPVDAMAMDVLLDGPRRVLRAGDELRLQVLRDGQPLSGLAVELQNDRSTLGLWMRTDREGRVRLKLPLAGHWLLRGTDLRVSDRNPDEWESRFVTLAFQVEPALAK
jgi:hypothetical protein